MDIDRSGFPNVGNNIFYGKEFTVGAMLPVVAPDNTTAPIRREITNPPVMDGMIKETEKKIVKFNEDPLTEEEKEVYEKAIIEYGEFPITKSYGILLKGKNEEEDHWNPVVEISGYDCKFRGRCEMLVIKDNKIFMVKLDHKKDDATYRVPGGAWDKNESHDQAAKRECEEEANIIVKNIMFGAKRVFIEDDYQKWVKENVPEDIQWRGYYTEVFVGTFDSYYKGEIADDDKDKDFIKNGKFYNIDEVWDILTPDHKSALNKYLAKYPTDVVREFTEDNLEDFKVDSSFMEYVKNRSSIPDEEFGIPEERKYPLDSKKHVESAIKLFNHVDEKYEEQLAKAIKKKAKVFGVDILSLVGEKNRLRNYIVTTNESEDVKMENFNDLDAFYFGEKVSENNEVPDQIESAIDGLEEKGYDVKYSSSGYANTRFKEDRDDDGVINGKLVSTARVIFARDYHFDNTPDGWEWKVLDNGFKALYVKPFTYNDKYGTEREAFAKWKQSYLQSLRSWVDDLPKVGETKTEEEKEEEKKENKKEED